MVVAEGPRSIAGGIRNSFLHPSQILFEYRTLRVRTVPKNRALDLVEFGDAHVAYLRLRHYDYFTGCDRETKDGVVYSYSSILPTKKLRTVATGRGLN